MCSIAKCDILFHQILHDCAFIYAYVPIGQSAVKYMRQSLDANQGVQLFAPSTYHPCGLMCESGKQYWCGVKGRTLSVDIPTSVRPIMRIRGSVRTGVNMHHSSSYRSCNLPPEALAIQTSMHEQETASRAG